MSGLGITGNVNYLKDDPIAFTAVGSRAQLVQIPALIGYSLLMHSGSGSATGSESDALSENNTSVDGSQPTGDTGVSENSLDSAMNAPGSNRQ